MTALAKGRPITEERWTTHTFTLTSGKKAWKNGSACIDTTTGKVVPGAPSLTLKYIGLFAADVDATLGDTPVLIYLVDEIAIIWFANSASSDAVSAANLGSDCYVVDDQTVGLLRAGRSTAGIVWAVDTVKGVAVQKASGTNALASAPVTPAYVSNASSPTDIVNGGFYDVPTTAAASTIVLPAAAADGTRAYFLADGTKNAHTIQYVDATGSVNLTTALTASKRHLVEVAKLGGKWFANAYVSP